MNICFCIDENYVGYLGAVLRSLLESNGHNNLDIYIIHNGLTDKSQDYLKDIVFSKTVEWNIVFASSQDENVQKLKAGGHISSATYIRFEIPYILHNLDKVLYLDADLVVCDDLKEFWRTDISEYYVAAVVNPFFDRYDSINIDKSWSYFNAGILLMNLEKWRGDNVKYKALEFLADYKENAIMFDQDALNNIFEGKWKKVPLRWNLQAIYLRYISKLNLEIKSEVIDAYHKPGIIHYSANVKPWDFCDHHPAKSIFLSYLDDSYFKIKKISWHQKIFKCLKYLYWKCVYMKNGVHIKVVCIKQTREGVGDE